MRSNKQSLFSQEHPILNLRINAINMLDALKFIFQSVSKKNSSYICCVPVHTIMDGYDDPKVKIAIDESSLNTPDGMAVVWLLKLAGFKNVSRVYGPDLMLNTCKKYPQFRHYFFGGTEETNERLRKNLLLMIPNLTISGHDSPIISIDAIHAPRDLINQINQSNPDIIWVAIGSPKQELWMYENQKNFPTSLLIGVGAAFDFLSGNKHQAPKWIQKSGLEWLFRFFSEPKRLWKRYLLGYPRFVFLLFKQKLGLLKFPD
jgi:N-acetylglucosaminyldiphosphoundecaprenol N-acetyl-beta-D-mannosaminyltransferase